MKTTIGLLLLCVGCGSENVVCHDHNVEGGLSEDGSNDGGASAAFGDSSPDAAADAGFVIGPACQKVDAGNFYGNGSFDGTDSCGRWLYHANNVNGEDGGNTDWVSGPDGGFMTTTGAPNDSCYTYAGLGLGVVICSVPSCTVYYGGAFSWHTQDGGLDSEWKWYWLCPGGVQVPPQSAGSCEINIPCPDGGMCDLATYWCQGGY
jgi:hypothetical protein